MSPNFCEKKYTSGDSVLVDCYAMLLVALGVFAIYAVYPLAYYGVTGYSSLNVVKFGLFALFGWMFLSCLSVSAGWSAVFLAYFAAALAVFGFFVGIYRSGLDVAVLTHFLYYVMFIFVSVIGYKHACAKWPLGGASRLSDGIWRAGVVLALLLIVSIHVFRSASHNPSITFPFLCLAFAYFLWKKNWLFTILCVAGLIISLKRGMWVSICALGLVLFIRVLIGFILSGGRLRKQVLLGIVCALIMSFSSLISLFWFGGPVFDNLLERLAVSIPSGLSYQSLDAASSGRFGDFVAVYSKVISDCNVWTGCGFGVEYNYFDYNDPWVITTSWVKSGSDVMFLHLFLIFGFLGLLIYFIFFGLFLVSVFGLLQVAWDSVKFFAYASYFLAFLTCLFSFSFFDPMFPGCFGFCLALAFQTNKDLQ
ncbi:hypothetical protein HP436_07040 [Pseudomonas sp. CrR14]|nr:hypothetical protein [Pseudomonas sp. CrR14]